MVTEDNFHNKLLFSFGYFASILEFSSMANAGLVLRMKLIMPVMEKLTAAGVELAKIMH